MSDDDRVERWKSVALALRAELAAANARSRELEREIDERDKAHEGIVATITAAARADTRTAKSDAAKVQMLAERVDALTLSRDKHRNRAAAANTRCAELEEEVMAHQVSDGYTKGYEHGTLTTAKFKAERDALQATLDWVVAAIKSSKHKTTDHEGSVTGYLISVADLRAALTPEGTP